MDIANRRLKQVQRFLHEGGENKWRQVLVLPDDARVSILEPQNGEDATKIAIDGHVVLNYRPTGEEAALVISALGTPFEKDSPAPKYPILELSGVDGKYIQPSDLWASIYTLWTLLHTQEHIPVILSSNFSSLDETTDYILLSGLGRRALDPSLPRTLLFLSRATFWQGAGTGPAWSVSRGWLQDEYGARAAAFPSTQSFTRNPLVIAAHPLRAPKAPGGSCLYRRYVAPVGKVLSLHVFDPESEAHMGAFHRWQNDERVNKGWGEKGSMEKHREYIANVTADPSFLPFVMSWDGELMGYGEIVWIKENHVAAYVPGGALDHDRGMHILVGEDKFRGQVYSQGWFRSITHYILLADPRTYRIVGEPKRNNPAIIKTSCDAGMHLETSFYFPYKYSVMTMNLRERFFKEDMLT